MLNNNWTVWPLIDKGLDTGLVSWELRQEYVNIILQDI